MRSRTHRHRICRSQRSPLAVLWPSEHAITCSLAARQQFVAEVDGATVVVLQGACFPVASAIVKQYPEMFEKPNKQASEAPGQKRQQ